jgi:hypothetical protein
VRTRSHKFALIGIGLTFALMGLAAPVARASFGFLPGPSGFEVTTTEHNGSPDTQAGSHPYQMITTINFNLASESPTPPGGPFTDGDLRDLSLELPPGLIENPSAVPKCTQAQFNTPRSSPFEASASGESCPQVAQVGVVAVHTSFAGGSTRTFGVFNLVPPPGAPSRFGFSPFGDPVVFTPTVRQAEGEYGLTLELENLSQRLDLYGLRMTIWGAPWNLAHNTERGNCLNEVDPTDPFAKCSVGRPANHLPQAYLTLPTACSGPLIFTAAADSWQQPAPVSTTSTGPALEGCQLVNPSFNELATAEPTSQSASTPSGLDFNLELPPEGLTEPEKLAPSQVRTAVLTLPEGMTLNPSVASGLGVCTPAQYAAEAVSTPPGGGCPNASKIGDLTVQSPLFEGSIKGSLFLAEPFQNPTGSLIALYLVAKSPERGVIVKVAGAAQADPVTGRLLVTFEDLPQLPYTHFTAHLREGHRAPLVTPATCGLYSTQTNLTPWPDPTTIRRNGSSFNLTSGIGGGACPAGAPPFAPQAQGGNLNSYAGAYTPFYLHLTRTDGEQEITSYSAQLPPGLLGNLSGVPFCPEADIAAAKRASGVQETAHPSCPAASEIGHTYTGYGVGGVLAYAPGGLYLAGPYHGSPLSIVAIDSATVGPFDLGVIVVRSAIRVDPRTAQVSIDSAASDPIPHILDGIPLRLRDIRVYISRPHFTVNPTSCDPSSVTSTLTGSSAPFTNPLGATATVTAPFRVLFCSSLEFAPQLALKLKGGTRRGDFPQLTATVTPRPGDANIAAAAVTLPSSEFLEQAHIGTICTRPQMEAEACPANSVYGHASAITPLLEAPMEGPVYLRSSANKLPDLVAVLHGRGVRILLEGRIDAKHGGLRGTFEGLPDAPLTKFTMTLDGGKRGLLVNAANVCTSTKTANARFVGQNNTGVVLHPRLEAKCSGKHSKRHHKHTKKRRGSS